jgi:hypothetical protein
MHQLQGCARACAVRLNALCFIRGLSQLLLCPKGGQCGCCSNLNRICCIWPHLLLSAAVSLHRSSDCFRARLEGYLQYHCTAC